MAYRTDYAKSARRHLSSGCKLFDETNPGERPGRRAVAGYLFGLTGELAIKQLMRENGMKPLREDQRRDDPFYAHFPKLASLLRDLLEGRRAESLRRLIMNDAYFQFWHTDMRYAPTADIRDEWVTKWQEQAKKLVDEMGAQ